MTYFATVANKPFYYSVEHRYATNTTSIGWFWALWLIKTSVNISI